MSETCTSPSNELWLLDTESCFCDARGASWGNSGLGGAEEGGVDGRFWEEPADAGWMGVNAEAGVRVGEFGDKPLSWTDFAAESVMGEERIEDWGAPGEVSGLVEGRMDEESVEDDWAAHWVEEDDAKEGGRVAEEYVEEHVELGVEEATVRVWWMSDSWLEDVISVLCVSSVLCGILLCEKMQIKLMIY